MPIIDPRAAEKIQPELFSGETIYWAGMPNPGIIFHSDDRSTIPFSLVWAGFTVIWEGQGPGIWRYGGKPSPPNTFMILWGIPFLLLGQYLLWGRFFIDAWLKRRTYYAVTNRRVLLLQEGWKRKTNFVYLESLPDMDREGSSTGSLWLGPKLPIDGPRASSLRSASRFDFSDTVPVLADIDDLDDVERLIIDLRGLREKSLFPFLAYSLASIFLSLFQALTLANATTLTSFGVVP